MTDLYTLPFHQQLLVREYGFSTYQLILGLKDIEDLGERTKRAGQLVQLMLRLQPALREQVDVQTRLWNHLHALAGDDVALDAPVPLHDSNRVYEKPARVPYPTRGPKLRAYGAAVEALISKALTLEDAAEREQATALIGRTMKFLYRQHNKENAKDQTILRHLGELSGGQLHLDPALVDSQRLFEMPGGGAAPEAQPGPRRDGQPREGQNRDGQPRESRREGREGQPRDGREGRRDPDGRDRNGERNGDRNSRSGKKRKKGRAQEPQQPPQ